MDVKQLRHIGGERPVQDSGDSMQGQGESDVACTDSNWRRYVGCSGAAFGISWPDVFWAMGGEFAKDGLKTGTVHAIRG